MKLFNKQPKEAEVRIELYDGIKIMTPVQKNDIGNINISFGTKFDRTELKVSGDMLIIENTGVFDINDIEDIKLIPIEFGRIATKIQINFIIKFKNGESLGFYYGGNGKIDKVVLLYNILKNLIH